MCAGFLFNFFFHKHKQLPKLTKKMNKNEGCEVEKNGE